MKRKLLELLIIVVLLLPIISPVFKPYVSGTADGLGHKFRLVSFYKSLEEGNLRPRWAKEAAFGFGAPIFIYNYPLPYYLGSLFVKLGNSINRSGQLLSAFSFFFSGVLMFIAARRLTNSFWGGITSAIVYAYAPYHLQMSYLYGAWGEELAFIFPPLILYLISQPLTILSYVVLIFSWVLFALAHNLSAVMLSPMLLFLGFIALDFKWKKFLILLNAFFLVILISAFFWLPGLKLVNEVKYPELLLSEGAMRGAFFKSLSFQLETAVKVIREGITHYLDFTVGLPIMLGVGIALITLITSFLRRHTKEEKLSKGVAFYWIFGLLMFLIVCLFLVNNVSNKVWQLPLVLWMPPSYILYPFRFLIAASFVGALLVGILVRKSFILALIFVILAIIQGRPYTNPYTDTFPFPDSYFWQKQTVFAAPFTHKNLIIIEHLPKQANLTFLKQEEDKYYQEYYAGKANEKRDEAFISSGEGTLSDIQSFSERMNLKLEAKKEVTLTINRFYFPNWQAYIDGKTVPIHADSSGRMTVTVTGGIHDFSLVFGLAPIEKISNSVTFIGLILLVIEITAVRGKLLIP
jgi:hypothetical protein